jgi:hypothetical protein
VDRPVKPAYSTSKLALWISSGMAWAVIVILAIGAVMGSEQAVAFGTVAVPSMCMLIAMMLGIHRGFGSLDMRTIAGQQLPEGNP